MPVYEYHCKACGHSHEEYQKITSDALGTCPNCQRRAGYGRVPSVPHTNLIEFADPIEMYSIALDDDEEIKAFKQRCPDVHVSTDKRDDLYGVPVAANRAQKLAALKATGFEERN